MAFNPENSRPIDLTTLSEFAAGPPEAYVDELLKTEDDKLFLTRLGRFVAEVEPISQDAAIQAKFTELYGTPPDEQEVPVNE